MPGLQIFPENRQALRQHGLAQLSELVTAAGLRETFRLAGMHEVFKGKDLTL